MKVAGKEGEARRLEEACIAKVAETRFYQPMTRSSMAVEIS
jgi:hypothetical protein